ncbi:hypothetical protein KHA80_21140 [Anaerobacillus sp. HL2]|nr:hypothetical protein KHA80_21140 [Anaerobacillus sp. HL2]
MQVKDISKQNYDLALTDDNPPYGERLGEIEVKNYAKSVDVCKLDVDLFICLPLMKVEVMAKASNIKL